MKTKILDLNVLDNKRLLFISDIHADLDGFKAILDKVNYTKDDYLFLVGDVIEKGLQNVSILDYIMTLIEDGYNTYMICGNCDNVLSYMIPPVQPDLLLNYALEKKKTIINSLAYKLNEEIHPYSDMDELCSRMYNECRIYYDFVFNCNHVININNKITAVHGGILDEDNIDSNPLNIMKFDNFYKISGKKNKLMIVGHYPTIIYQDIVPNCNPIIDLEKNIISIDGGNNVVPWGQLNMLIIDSIGNMNISYITYDSFKSVTIDCDVLVEEDYFFNIDVRDNEIIILDSVEDFYKCIHKSSKREVFVLKSMVYFNPNNKKTYTYDAFNYFTSFKKGDMVSLVFDTSPYCVVKKDGVASLILKEYIRR